MNTGEPQPMPGLFSAERRVLGMQTKLHRWTGEDRDRRFDDLFNLVADPSFLLVAHKRVLALVKAFCKAGILTELGEQQETRTGTPQGGILSPLLANIALSVLDDYFVGIWQASMKDHNARFRRRQKGLANWRLIRYADDWVAMVAGTRADAEQLRQGIAVVLAPMGLRLSEEKTKVVHLAEGFDFLGYHIRWQRKRGTNQRHVYTYPSKKALTSIKTKVRALTCQKTHPDLKTLLWRINPVARGWCHYFKYGSSSGAFGYLNHYLWWRVARWLRKRHGRLSWKQLRRKVFTDGYRIVAGGIELFNPSTVATVHQRWRGYNIPTPWSEAASSPAQ